MNLTERLRSVVAGRLRTELMLAGPPHICGPGATVGDATSSVDPAIDGEWRGSTRCSSTSSSIAPILQAIVMDTWLSPMQRQDRTAVGPCLSMLEPAISGARLLFLDLETTGLAGGAGNVRISCGLWMVRQRDLQGSSVPAGLVCRRAAAARGLADTIAAAGTS